MGGYNEEVGSYNILSAKVNKDRVADSYPLLSILKILHKSVDVL